MGMSEVEKMNESASTGRRNPMLASTEPTDEELQRVMLEARDVAVRRKLASDAWMLDQLNLAVQQAQERAGMRPHG
jgi:1,2-phenylacetyl-CoA epoxidase PaaB subunit